MQCKLYYVSWVMKVHDLSNNLDLVLIQSHKQWSKSVEWERRKEVFE